MKRKTVVLIFFCVFISITGCKAPDEAKIYDKPLPPGEYALRKLTDADDISVPRVDLGDQQRRVPAVPGQHAGGSDVFVRRGRDGLGQSGHAVGGGSPGPASRRTSGLGQAGRAVQRRS